MNQTIKVDTDDRGVATVTLNIPEKHNALSAEMISELAQAAHRLGGDPNVRAVILTGAGKSFCAGGDLNWMRAQMDGDDVMRAGAAKSIARMLNALNTLPKPLIGRVNGNAFGGGVGLASVCDVAVAVRTANFGFTETKLGLIPATIGPYVLARMGEAKARRVFMSGRVFDAAEALMLGLVARTVSPNGLDAAVDAEIIPYLSCSPDAIAAAKALARKLGPVIDDAAIQHSIDALTTRWRSNDAREGVAAFFDKRLPDWAK